ncbi:iron complex transport system substrate-binding protein [Tissierella praeacuta]|uniref:ABC transporter substrate-binding protein n=1 Tax=Tissierella praeacuta TaxID=43131 RepID=UPI0010454237|nr:ABC transporter substrate-binding protein [Tissierella praeacuta]TCU77417.1 iron complex transport system substrate-binding protein [Tissierella praeacuta]
MKKLKNIFAIILSLCMIMSIFVGCENKKIDSTMDENQTTQVKQGKDDKVEGRVITDQVGHEIVLPDKIDRVVISSLWPLPSVYCLFQGSAEKLVGIHPASKSAAVYSLLPKIAPEIKDVETSFIQNGEMNVEELLKLKPDIVLGSNAAEYEMVTKANIPYVQFVANPKGDGNAIESVGAWLKLLGQIFDKEDRAETIMNEGYEVLEQVQTVVNEIKEEEKVRALIIFKYGEGKLMVAGKGHFGDFWLNQTGAINLAEEIEGIKEVNMEQIYTWNPDKIYLTNFTSYMPEDFYNNIIEGHDWSGVKAVQDKEVYKIPLGMYRWYPPSSDTPLMLKWLAQKNYPKLFEDMDIYEEVRKYYNEFYEMDLDIKEIEKIFMPSREAAKGV